MLPVRRLPDSGLLSVPLKGIAWIDNVSLTKATERSGCARETSDVGALAMVRAVIFCI